MIVSHFRETALRGATHARSRRMAALLLVCCAGAGAQSGAWSNILEYPVPNAVDGAGGITAGTDGALWFTEIYANAIGRITTAGAITEYPVPTAHSGPWAIAAGSDGALWFTEYNSNLIGRITTAGAIAEYPLPSGHQSEPITAGPDGALWFTDSSGSMIARVTTAGVITEYPVPNGGEFFTGGITAGPDGALWVAGSGKIARAPACGLGFSASFAAGTLTMNFNLGIDIPATFSIVLLNSTGSLGAPYSRAIPAVVPPKAFTQNWSSFPNLGTITVRPELGKSANQDYCAEWTTVNTAQ